MTRIKSRPAALVVLAAFVGAAFLLLSPASPVSAQTCPPGQVPNPADPYGCISTTTTTDGDGTAIPDCIVSNPSAVAGTRVDVLITNVPLGLTVNLLLNGQVVDSAVASTGDESALGLATAGPAKSARAPKAAPSQATLVDVSFEFVVPALAAGSYTVEAVGPGFQCDCFPFTVIKDVAGTTDNRGGDNLARTGFTVLGLLVLAAILLIVGRAMVEQGKRRNTA